MWPRTGRAVRKRRADRPASGAIDGRIVDADAVPAGGAGYRGYGSEQQQIVQRGHEQQSPDHRKEDHQLWLG